jgi:hypothetical protein
MDNKKHQWSPPPDDIMLGVIQSKGMWAFVYGEPIKLSDKEPKFFVHRNEALAAARRNGLDVDVCGKVKTLGK